MSSKAAPRKAGVIFATAFALASVFNTGASADVFRVRGNFSGPSRIDQYGLEIPGCITGNIQRVKFIPGELRRFAGKDDFLFEHKMGPGIGVDEGPIVYYNYEALKTMPVPIRNFMFYQACLLNYYSDQALDPPINKTDYTINEIKADCSAAVILREEKRLDATEVRLLSYVLNAENMQNGEAQAAKIQRRIRNITECYFNNKMVENLNPPKPGGPG
jgi:hypothetical protein